MAFNPNSNSSTNYTSKSSTNYTSNSSTNYTSNSSANYNPNSSVPNYVNYANYTIPAMMNPDLMMRMFHEYKESCRVRLDGCDDDRSRVTVLECMVTELLEQNELLLNSLIEYGSQRNQSKDSLITSSTSFGSNYSSASFDSGYNQMVSSALYPCIQYNPYAGQCPLQTNTLQMNPIAKSSSVQKSSTAHAQDKKSSTAHAQDKKSSYTSSKVGACSVKDECNQTSDSTTNEEKTINELKTVNEKINDEKMMLISENDSLKETNGRLISGNKSLEEDLTDLREENDNLRHDMANLVQFDQGTKRP